MTWSLSASGHHSKQYDEWEIDEYQILEDTVQALLKDSSNNTTTFNFNGNHVSANSLQEAIVKVAEYRAKS